MPNDRPDPTSPNGGSREPNSEKLGRRNFAGDSYAANEREQTRDLRRADPGPESVEDDDRSDADVANDENGE